MKQAISILFCFFILQAGLRAMNHPDTSAFPRDFIGNWKGKLQWFEAGKPTREISMQLIIQPVDSIGLYTWQIIYGDEGKDNRPYILKAVNSDAGHWVVDEGDGILLDSYVHGNSIHGAFTVQGSTVVDNYTIEDGKMKVEYLTIRLGEKKTSGKGTEDTPYVDSYRVAAYQSGVLSKIGK